MTVGPPLSVLRLCLHRRGPPAFPRSPSPGIPLTWLSEAETMLVCAPMFDWGDWDWGDRNDPNDLGGSGNVLPLLDPEADADQREAGP